MNFDLIIFDCDGVLIDSEILSNRAEVELLKSFGIEFELGDYMAQFVGKSTKDVLKTIEVSHAISLPAEFRRLAETQIFTSFKTELQPIPGIFELINSIDTAKCVASSSSLSRLDITLKITGLLSAQEIKDLKIKYLSALNRERFSIWHNSSNENPYPNEAKTDPNYD